MPSSFTLRLVGDIISEIGPCVMVECAEGKDFDYVKSRVGKLLQMQEADFDILREGVVVAEEGELLDGDDVTVAPSAMFASRKRLDEMGITPPDTESEAADIMADIMDPSDVSDTSYEAALRGLPATNEPITLLLDLFPSCGAVESHKDASPLELAVSSNRRDIVRLMLTTTEAATHHRINDGEDGVTVLHRAALWGYYDVAETLISHGADPCLHDRKLRSTPLHHACSMGRYEVASLLLEHKACPNARDMTGCTPLHSAAQSGFPRLVSLLLSHGADPQIQCNESLTPAGLASIVGSREVLNILEPRKRKASETFHDPR